MKRIITYFIIISLLWGCVGNGNVVSAKAKIQSTVQDMSGVKRKLTIDSVKHVSTQLVKYNYPGEYAQVADGHYYYLRQTGKNDYYTLYRDKGKKVGSFKYRYKEAEELGFYLWRAFGWHEGKLYVEFVRESERKIIIGVVDFKQETIKRICTLNLSDLTKSDFNSSKRIHLYKNKIYVFVTGGVVREFDMSSGSLLNKFSFLKLGKYERRNSINIADGKIYYAIEYYRKGKKHTVTFRCIDMASNKDKKVFQCNVSGEAYLSDNLIMKGKEIYYCRLYDGSGSYAGYYDWYREVAYSIPSAGGKMQQIGQGKIRDFAYNNKYYFYIDLKYRLHQQNRKTGRDQIISGIKVSTVDCTKKGLYVQKYDKWFMEEGFEDSNVDYAPALYFMNFNGKNVKKIAKYTIGHYSYDGWW